MTKDSIIVRSYADSIDLARSTTDRTVIRNEAIHAKAPYQLQEVVNDVPGVFIRQYGGLGGLATVSVRGGSAAQSLVTLDGVRLNTVQAGTADVTTIPLSMIQQVDVQRGALSATYGSNAMNGVMDLQLSVPTTGMRFSASGGSFDSWKGAWVGALNTDNVAIGAAVEAIGSQGNYAYSQTIDGEHVEINRQNGQVHSTSGLLRFEGPQASRLTLIVRNTNRGVPGAVVDDVITQANALFREQDVLGIGGADVVRSDNQRLHIDCAFRYMDQHYTDPQATIVGLHGIDARYLSRELNTVAKWTAVFDHVVHSTTAHIGIADMRGTSLQPSVGDYVVRRQFGASYQLLWSVDNVEASATCRYDGYSDVQGAVIGNLGVAWLIDTALTLRSAIGTGYRAPSFSEMYLLNYGNANLKPERSLVGSIGIHWLPITWITTDLSFYASTISNLIVSVPLSPVVTSAMNVGRASSMGLECSAAATLLSRALTLSWKYTLQDVRDRTGRAGLDGSQIVYTPVEMIHASAQWNHASVNGRIEWSYTSYRYAQPGAEITSVLKPYQLVNAVVGTTIKGKAVTMNLQLRVDNVFNQRYAVIRGFPMPGTMVRIATELVL